MINAVKDIENTVSQIWNAYFYYHFLGTQGQQIIMVSSAGGLKQISGATMSQAGLSQLSGGGPGGVKMVVVSSGQLAQAQNTKPITISMPGTGSQKTVTLSGTVYVF